MSEDKFGSDKGGLSNSKILRNNQRGVVPVSAQGGSLSKASRKKSYPNKERKS